MLVLVLVLVPARIYVLMDHEFRYGCECVGIVKTSLVNLDFVMRSVMESLHGIDARFYVYTIIQK